MSFCAVADDWTTGDTVRQGALTALLVADWGQTRYIVKHPNQCISSGCLEEDGSAHLLIGNHPSVGQVNNYFAASIVFNAAVSYALPSEWRHAWQYVSIGFEGSTVLRNKRIGIKIEF